MKKLITLLLVFAGMVGTASATDWYVTGTETIVNGSGWEGISNSYNKMEIASGTIYVLAVENKSVTKNTDYYFKITDGTTEYPSSAYDGSYKINFTESANYTIVYYFNSETHAIRVIVTPMLRWDLGNNGNGNWTWAYEANSMFTKDGYFTWTYELLPGKFTKDTSFRIYSSLFGKSAYPNGQDVTVTYGDDLISSNWFNADNTDYSWKINKPNYTYNKVIIKAVYNPFANDDFGTWDVSADAYISKTANGTNAGTNLGYSTFGAETNVDLSNLPSGVTAQTATVDANGKITYNSASELAKDEGVLLTNTTGTNQILSIPVKASASAVSANALRRVAATTLAQTDGSYVHYILTKNTVNNNDAELGWYKVNAEGCNSLTVGTAYLRVNTSTPDPSRGFFPLWSDEPTAVTAVATEQSLDGQAYNMAGQRVVRATKGLYIVNGKKVVK